MIEITKSDMQTIVRGLHSMLDMQEMGLTDEEAGKSALALMERLNREADPSGGALIVGDDLAIVSNLVTGAIDSERYLIERQHLMDMDRVLYSIKYQD